MPRKKQPAVPVDDNLGEMLNYAVRYTLGRMTYAPHNFVAYCRPLLPNLSERTLWVMARDIEEAARYGRLGSVDIDAPVWLTFLTDVKKELAEREKRKCTS